MDSILIVNALKSELASEVLRSSGRVHLCVTGYSMLPAIMPGDRLVIDRMEESAVSVGDVVLFSGTSRLVAHRVTEKSGEWVVTRGDAVAVADAPIRSKDVLGKVSFIVRNERCFEAKKSLGRSQRALVTLIRHSRTAARLIVELRGLHRASRKTV